MRETVGQTRTERVAHIWRTYGGTARACISEGGRTRRESSLFVLRSTTWDATRERHDYVFPSRRCSAAGSPEPESDAVDRRIESVRVSTDARHATVVAFSSERGTFVETNSTQKDAGLHSGRFAK